MNESTLIAVFGGVERFRALRALYAEPQRGFGQRELAAEAGIDPGSVARLLKRWTAAGVVTRRQQEGLPRYYASTDPALTPLVTLMQQDSALVHTLREFFTGMTGIQVAVIFGSMARGATGAHSDVDVLVLGTASELKLNASLKPVGRTLGRPINATVSTIEDFKAQLRAGEGFAQSVAQGPKISLIGDFDAAVAQPASA